MGVAPGVVVPGTLVAEQLAAPLSGILSAGTQIHGARLLQRHGWDRELEPAADGGVDEVARAPATGLGLWRGSGSDG